MKKCKTRFTQNKEMCKTRFQKIGPACVSELLSGPLILAAIFGLLILYTRNMEFVIEVLFDVIFEPAIYMVSRIFPGKRGSRAVKVVSSVLAIVLFLILTGLVFAGLVLMTTSYWYLGVILLSVGASLLFIELVIGAVFAYRNIGKDDRIEF